MIAPRTRFARAFAIAPLAAPAAYAGALLLVTVARAALGRDSLPSLGALVDLLRGVAALGIPVAYVAALAAGGPAVLVLCRLGVLRPVPLAVVGAGIGVAVALLLAPLLRGELFSIPFPWWAGGLLGLASAAAFWSLLGLPSRRPLRAGERGGAKCAAGR